MSQPQHESRIASGGGNAVRGRRGETCEKKPPPTPDSASAAGAHRGSELPRGTVAFMPRHLFNLHRKSVWSMRTLEGLNKTSWAVQVCRALASPSRGPPKHFGGPSACRTAGQCLVSCSDTPMALPVLTTDSWVRRVGQLHPGHSLRPGNLALHTTAGRKPPPPSPW